MERKISTPDLKKFPDTTMTEIRRLEDGSRSLPCGRDDSVTTE
jgi:hypothetical protein